MSAPIVTNWVRVTRGPLQGKEGVVDNIRDFAVGTRYRVIDPRDKTNHGWFTEEQLTVIPAPVMGEPLYRELGLSLLMGGEQ